METKYATPLPEPPTHELNNPITVKTIIENPDLFKIITPIKVNVLKDLAKVHPNQPYVESICTSLQKGFWPWADTSKEPPDITRDYHQPCELSTEQLEFLQQTCLDEQEAGRYSDAFGPELLPGMVSQPLFAVPKPRSNKLRLVNHHSAGGCPLNDLIPRDDRRIRLDNLHDFGKALRAFHQKHGRRPRYIFKSDVLQAFRLMPMHPHWQIRQVITVPFEGKLTRFIDRTCCFGSGGSPHIFCSFFSLVIWIAIFVRSIDDIFHYMDDAFGIEDDPELVYYAPYDSFYPKKQVKLLLLWDELGIPHEKRKQEYGSTLEVIGFELDTDKMTITMSEEHQEKLIDEIDLFNSHGRQPRLKEWQSLTGWMQWALNAYPLLRPAVNPMYHKTKGKVHQYATIPINRKVRTSLTWFRDRITTVSGVSMLEAEVWRED